MFLFIILFYTYANGALVVLADGDSVLCGGVRAWSCSKENSFSMIEQKLEKKPQDTETAGAVVDETIEQRDVYLLLDEILKDSDILFQFAHNVEKAHARMSSVLGEEVRAFTMDDSITIKKATVTIAALVDGVMRDIGNLDVFIDFLVKHSPDLRMIIIQTRPGLSPHKFDASGFVFERLHVGVVQPEEYAWEIHVRKIKEHEFLGVKMEEL